MAHRLLVKPFTTLAVAACAFAGVAQGAPQDRQSKSMRVEETPALTGAPMLAVVSLVSQRISVYDGAGNAIRARVSSGMTEY